MSSSLRALCLEAQAAVRKRLGKQETRLVQTRSSKGNQDVFSLWVLYCSGFRLLERTHDTSFIAGPHWLFSGAKRLKYDLSDVCLASEKKSGR